MDTHKGVLLAGGLGTRLRPATHIYNKHLALVYNKPMVLFPLETLKSLGVTEVLLVTGGNHIGAFADFLGDGSEYGVKITYKVQPEAGGIAQALKLAKDFVGDSSFYVILGDNVFENKNFEYLKPTKPTIFLREVPDAHRFGVYDPETNQIVEKPENPKSNLAVTGLYFYTPEVFEFDFAPSARGELEITDINNAMLTRGMETRKLLDFWCDAGTPESLLRSANFIAQQQ